MNWSTKGNFQTNLTWPSIHPCPLFFHQHAFVSFHFDKSPAGECGRALAKTDQHGVPEGRKTQGTIAACIPSQYSVKQFFLLLLPPHHHHLRAHILGPFVSLTVSH